MCQKYLLNIVYTKYVYEVFFMLYNNYEDYMRNVLGCSNMSNNPYEQSDWNYQHYNTYSSQCGNPYVNQYSNQYSNMYNNSMSLAECEQPH